MHLIILPGNSKQFNEKWLEESAEQYGDLFESTITHTYDHWENGAETISIDREVEKLVNTVKKLKGDYLIFAKSAGTVVTTKAIFEGKVKPAKCVFVGCPWDNFAYEQGDFEEWVKALTMPLIFVQQTNDMFFKYDQLEKLLEQFNLPNFELIEIEGENHAYDEYDFLKELLK